MEQTEITEVKCLDCHEVFTDWESFVEHKRFHELERKAKPNRHSKLIDYSFVNR